MIASSTRGGERYRSDAYAASVRRAFELLVDATKALRPQPLKLTISVTPTFAAKWLIPRLPDFTAAHPGSDLRIVATERLSHFQTEGVDLAVRYGHPPFGPGLNAELLFEDVLVAVAGPGVSAGKRRRSASEKCTLLHDAHNLWPQFLAQMQPERPFDVKNIHLSQMALAIDAALEGQGIALANPAFVTRDIAAGRLAHPFAQTFHTGAGFYLVFPRRQQHPEAVAALREWLHQRAQVSAE